MHYVNDSALYLSSKLKEKDTCFKELENYINSLGVYYWSNKVYADHNQSK